MAVTLSSFSSEFMTEFFALLKAHGFDQTKTRNLGIFLLENYPETEAAKTRRQISERRRLEEEREKWRDVGYP